MVWINRETIFKFCSYKNKSNKSSQTYIDIRPIKVIKYYTLIWSVDSITLDEKKLGYCLLL